jgi:hypothetical protein
MKKFAFALVALATALAISPAAKADSFTVTGIYVDNGTYVPSLSKVQATGNGTVFGVQVANWVTLNSSAIAGTPDTYTLQSATPVGDSFTISSTTDQYGNTVAAYDITFSVTSYIVSTGENNLATGTGTIVDDGQIYQATWSASTATNGIESFTFDATPTPEPSTLLLLGTGLLGLAFALFRKNAGLALR